MMKIQITAGTYGHRVGDRVNAVRAGDPPIEVTSEIGERLLHLGVAVAIEEEEKSGAAASDVENVEAEASAEVFPDYDEKMTRAQLEKIALSVGIDQGDLDAATKKSDVLVLLDEARADFEAEEAPSFDPAGDML